MRNRTVATLMMAAGLCLVPASFSLAQRESAGRAIADSTPPSFDLTFPGGTLGEYFDAVAEAGGANIVAGEEVRALDMPAVRLRGVKAWAAVNMVQAMFDDPDYGMVRIASVAGDPAAAGPMPSAAGTDERGEPTPIFVASLRRGRSEPVASSVNEVFSVGDVLRPANEEPVDLQVTRLFEMIDSAMQLAPGDESPELAFHDETQMLVFRGSSEQRRLIESVLERYDNSWRPKSNRAQGIRREIADLELEARTAMIEAEAVEQRRGHVERSLQELRQLVEAGAASQRDLAEASAEAAELQSRIQILAARAEHARRVIAEQSEALSALSPGQEASVVRYDARGLGARGDQICAAFKALLDVADLPGTRMESDGAGSVTLAAQPPVHEMLRYLLGHVRDAAGAGR